MPGSKRVVEVPFDTGVSVTVTYDRDELISAAAEHATPDAVLEKNFAGRVVTIEALAGAIISWDLSDDGRPYPTDRDSLMRLPVSVLLTIAQEVEADAFGDDR